ncbi:MAG TPA: sigma 54-interacting transcriptional regulator [Blastocatellia bacterium]|nr:sigma 54-interacting transcriptional regulator [Blastocatellia bacterium]
MASRNPFTSSRVEDAVAAGQEALEDSRFEEAATHFQSALRMGPHPLEQEAIIRCKLSLAFEKRGMNREQMEAVSKYDNFADFVRLSEQIQMQVLVRLGWGHSYSNDIPRAIALFNQAMRIARRLEDRASIGACYFGLGRAYRFVSEIRIARDQYSSALDYFRQVGSWRELAESYFNIGNIDFREGDYRNALQSIKQALAIIGDRNEHELLGRAYSDLALIYDNVELPTARALAAWEKCIDHFQKAGNTFHLAINYNNLGYRLMWLGEWDRAEQMLTSAIEILKQTSRVVHLAGTIDTLAQLQVLRGRLDEADRLLQDSLAAFATIKNNDPLNKDHPLESSTHTTIGRFYLMKGRTDLAMTHLERAVDIALRLGDRQYFSEARLWLAEGQIQCGKLDEARKNVETVRAHLRDTPDMLIWGLMMRMVAKIEAAQGHLAAAIQSLGQSTSIFEIRGSVYDRALNRVVRAQMLERRGSIKEAQAEVETALAVFDRLGAEHDRSEAASLLQSLNERQSQISNLGSAASGKATAQADHSPHLASVLDGFIAQRLVQASVSRELLLHELASITREEADSRAAVVAEITQSGEGDQQSTSLKIAATVGLGEGEIEHEVEFLRSLAQEDYGHNSVFAFSDKQLSSFLLHIIEPEDERFRARTVRMEPLIYLIEQGLETQVLKSKTRRTHVFTPARLLQEVEMPGFICASRAMSRVLEQINKIRSSDVTVLITGESGTGKELIARAVHAGSSRRFNVFLPFNCSAAPREMIESQLFGFRKGSFTGAMASNPGIIRAAEAGTLFLDELGDLPLDLQPKLLRFLQEGEIHPLGENQPIHVDVRVVAATNSDLERAVAEGKFREDLFHRLNVIRIQVPPLRERREEIPALINHYLNLYQQEAAKRDIQLSEETVDLMVVYEWPGNVRQLCNEVRRIVAYSDSGSIVAPDLLSPEIIRASLEIQLPSAGLKKMVEAPMAIPENTTLAEAVEDLERRMIQVALKRSSGNIARAAKELGLSRKGLYLKIDRLNFKV